MSLPSPVSGKRPSTAMDAVTYVERCFDLFRNAQNEVFGRRKGTNSPLQPLDGGPLSILNEVRSDFLKSAGVSLGRNTLDAVSAHLHFECSRAEPNLMFQRYARTGDGIFVDLGTADGRVVQIDKTDWNVLSETDILFTRTEVMNDLPTPAASGNLDLLQKYVNVEPHLVPVLNAWLVACLFPDIDHPILTFRGMAGSGKSVATGFINQLIDPSKTQKMSMPSSKTDWIAIARSSYMISFDNLSTFSSEVSDLLCVLVTGGSFSARKLYTNSEISYFEARRVLVVNGISLSGHGADLTDRMLPIDLYSISSDDMKDSSELDANWKRDKPEILAGLYDLTSKVLRELDYVQPRKRTRMAKFCEILACIDKVQGSKALDTYQDLLGAAAELEASDEPILQALTLAINTKWSGTARDLLALVHSVSSSLSVSEAPKLPSTTNALVAAFTRNAPTLRKMGWLVEEHGPSGHKKLKTYELSPPSP